jgi:hypothetical protein
LQHPDVPGTSASASISLMRARQILATESLRRKAKAESFFLVMGEGWPNICDGFLSGKVGQYLNA